MLLNNPLNSSPITSSLITATLVGALLTTLVCPTWAANDPAPIATTPTPSAIERRFCGDDPDTKVHILIGRFLLFGDADQPSSRNLEKAIVGGMVAGLLPRRDIAVFVW